MTSSEALIQVFAEMRKRLPGCAVEGGIIRSPEHRGWVAEVDVLGKTDRPCGHHEAYGPTKGTAVKHLAMALAVNIDEVSK